MNKIEKNSTESLNAQIAGLLKDMYEVTDDEAAGIMFEDRVATDGQFPNASEVEMLIETVSEMNHLSIAKALETLSVGSPGWVIAEWIRITHVIDWYHIHCESIPDSLREEYETLRLTRAVGEKIALRAVDLFPSVLTMSRVETDNSEVETLDDSVTSVSLRIWGWHLNERSNLEYCCTNVGLVFQEGNWCLAKVEQNV